MCQGVFGLFNKACLQGKLFKKNLNCQSLSDLGERNTKLLLALAIHVREGKYPTLTHHTGYPIQHNGGGETRETLVKFTFRKHRLTKTWDLITAPTIETFRSPSPYPYITKAHLQQFLYLVHYFQLAKIKIKIQGMSKAEKLNLKRWSKPQN